MNIGKRIQQLRSINKLTVRDVSSFVGCSPASVTFWEQEKNSPNAENIFKLAEILKSTPEYILTGIQTTNQAIFHYPIYDNLNDLLEKNNNKFILDAVKHQDKSFYWIIQDESMASPHSQYRQFFKSDMVLIYPSLQPKDGDYVLARHKAKDIVAVRYYLAQGGIVLLRVGNSIFESLNGNLEMYEVLGVVKQQIVRFE